MPRTALAPFLGRFQAKAIRREYEQFSTPNFRPEHPFGPSRLAQEDGRVKNFFTAKKFESAHNKKIHRETRSWTSKMADRQHILLAEDDPLDVELTLDAFAQNNFPHEITVVSDGEQALDYLYRREKFKTRPDWHPVFVLLDNEMPKVTGLDVVKIIKADENLSSIPIVALTSAHEAPDLKEFFKHGVNAYVVKPVQFSELVKVIKQIGIFWTEINESQEKTR